MTRLASSLGSGSNPCCAAPRPLCCASKRPSPWASSPAQAAPPCCCMQTKAAVSAIRQQRWSASGCSEVSAIHSTDGSQSLGSSHMTDIAMRRATAAGNTQISFAQEHFQKPAKLPLSSHLQLAVTHLEKTPRLLQEDYQQKFREQLAPNCGRPFSRTAKGDTAKLKHDFYLNHH